MVEKLKNAMAKGPVKFTYLKKDGSTREAIGTRNSQILEEVGYEYKGNGVEKAGVVSYWDMEKSSWRACREDSIISIEE